MKIRSALYAEAGTERRTVWIGSTRRSEAGRTGFGLRGERVQTRAAERRTDSFRISAFHTSTIIRASSKTWSMVPSMRRHCARRHIRVSPRCIDGGNGRRSFGKMRKGRSDQRHTAFWICKKSSSGPGDHCSKNWRNGWTRQLSGNAGRMKILWKCAGAFSFRIQNVPAGAHCRRAVRRGADGRQPLSLFTGGAVIFCYGETRLSVVQYLRRGRHIDWPGAESP